MYLLTSLDTLIIPEHAALHTLQVRLHFVSDGLHHEAELLN